MIRCKIRQSDQILIIEDGVLEYFRKHQQNAWVAREAGGQLFAHEITKNNEIRLVLATGPRASDVRTRTSYKPDRSAEQEEIDFHHKQGLHFVGDWHTHYEYAPQPSWDDHYSIGSVFQQSKHSAHAFLLMIVGRGKLPDNLYVGLYDVESFTQIYPLDHG